MSTAGDDVAPDGYLVRSARAGDMTAFALLVQRHQASLRATAIALLGYTDDADDAVQDALLIAMQRLPDLRDVNGFGPWAKAIVRNNCRAQLRARRAVPVPDPEHLLPPDPGPRPEDRLERAVHRDWVREAMAGLSAPVREVMLLRYFSGVSSYREIGQICGILPETVGSRLRDGRRALAQRLQETAGQVRTDVRADTAAAAWHRESTQILGAMADGTFARVLDDWYHPDASIVVMGFLHGRRTLLLNMLELTFSADVKVRLHNTMASKDVLLWEADFLNPPSDPGHCPPTMAALFTLDQGRVSRMGITYGTHHPSDHSADQ
ncbi:sigma-70 family RNA polymerase sigma factor [Kineosporia sp. NBRC 101731]|uniref:RNA polymerase sigma factor n=1 Tax=Kineosporia sp. NBRC 101731 TaxID=3032199 RepID=UPI0024A21102|nr:sigma-70 family RNA polymerase sigma factor [Kineosporia sp. NBRC 101731]GLY30887.1 hypothetical protein Kisp02_42520 [Kineosporia sp. NBRC 101731]